MTSGAVPAEALVAAFPKLALPITPPYAPMEAKTAPELPTGDGWLYEPKWDGFRCLAFRTGAEVALQSKSGQPLGRYFPEVVEALQRLSDRQFVLDGEITIFQDGALSFDDLLQRIHPAASRIRRLAAETPATFMVFDLLVDVKGKALVEAPLHARRDALERLFRRWKSQSGIVRLSPVSRELAVAKRWMRELDSAGLDGVIAKRAAAAYAGGERTAMVKVKRIRTADCVVGGFRYAQEGGSVGSLLLGLYNHAGELDHVGFTSSFRAEQRESLRAIVEPLVKPPGFTGRAPGGPSRWASERSGEWQPLRPKLVCEVRYDHFSGGRFRHGTKFLRWRPDKAPAQCTMRQVMPRPSKAALQLLKAA